VLNDLTLCRWRLRPADRALLDALRFFSSMLGPPTPLLMVGPPRFFYRNGTLAGWLWFIPRCWSRGSRWSCQIMNELHSCWSLAVRKQRQGAHEEGTLKSWPTGVHLELTSDMSRYHIACKLICLLSHYHHIRGVYRKSCMEKRNGGQ
jgi:hypothetical protein